METARCLLSGTQVSPILYENKVKQNWALHNSNLSGKVTPRKREKVTGNRSKQRKSSECGTNMSYDQFPTSLMGTLEHTLVILQHNFEYKFPRALDHKCFGNCLENTSGRADS